MKDEFISNHTQPSVPSGHGSILTGPPNRTVGKQEKKKKKKKSAG